MIYVFHMLDKPGTAELRLRLRPEHKAYLGRMADRIAFAGPLLQDDGATMLGSVLAIDFDSRGRSRSMIWACSASVAVETTTRSPVRSAYSMLGTR